MRGAAPGRCRERRRSSSQPRQARCRGAAGHPAQPGSRERGAAGPEKGLRRKRSRSAAPPLRPPPGSPSPPVPGRVRPDGPPVGAGLNQAQPKSLRGRLQGEEPRRLLAGKRLQRLQAHGGAGLLQSIEVRQQFSPQGRLACPVGVELTLLLIAQLVSGIRRGEAGAKRRVERFGDKGGQLVRRAERRLAGPHGRRRGIERRRRGRKEHQVRRAATPAPGAPEAVPGAAEARIGVRASIGAPWAHPSAGSPQTRATRPGQTGMAGDLEISFAQMLTTGVWDHWPS